jgi:predicted adenine nucleotide alpha hydrolase (AANH) superfamily ATPase
MTIDPELLKVIEKTIKEEVSKSIESVQLALLRREFLTRDEFLDVMNRMDKRFEAMDKRFEALQKRMDKRFKIALRRIDERFNNIDIGYSTVAEGVEYAIIKREFKRKGLDLDLKIRQHFTDKNHIVYPDSEDVEVDIFYYNPNIVGEAALKLSDLDKVRHFIKKIEFLEQEYDKPFQRFLFCLKVDDKIKSELEILTKNFNIELIIPKRI